MKKLLVLFVCLFLLVGCKNDQTGKEPGNGGSGGNTTTAKQLLEQKLIEYGKKIYESDTWTKGGIEPLTYYNQYEAPRVESVTFQFILESNEDSAIEVYKNFFQKCLESQKIDELVINAQSFRITSNGPNPFRKLVNACCSAHLEWQNVVKTEVE